VLLKVLRAKIHRATVTEADLDYVGSITIDPELTDASGIVPGECVLVADLSNGTRHWTYVMEGERGSGVVCINGAAARLVHAGDQVIVMSFAYVTPEEARHLKPGIVLVDDKNRVVRKL
jgi:aspartate 1-decarboxylase